MIDPKITIISSLSCTIGIIVGIYLCDPSAKAYDPCDKPKTYDKPYLNIEPYNEREDASMQLHWQDHQPSLHPK